MKTLAVLILLSFAAVAGAKETEAEPQSLKVATPAEFSQTRALIEIAVRESDQYRDMQEVDRAKLAEVLDRMEGTLAGITSVDELDKNQKTQLFNDQEMINNVLTQARDDSRMICKREKKVGSHRVTNICYTAGERRRQLERNKEANDRFHRSQRGGDSLFSNYTGVGRP